MQCTAEATVQQRAVHHVLHDGMHHVMHGAMHCGGHRRAACTAEATVEQRAVQVRNERAGLAQRARLAQSCHVVSHLWGEAGMP